MMAVASTNGKAETPILDDFRNGGRFFCPNLGVNPVCARVKEEFPFENPVCARVKEEFQFENPVKDSMSWQSLIIKCYFTQMSFIHMQLP